MTLINVNKGNYAKKYLIVHDAHIGEFNDSEDTVIALSPSKVRAGITCAKQEGIQPHITDDALTYQQLQDRLQIAEVTANSYESEIDKIKAKLVEAQDELNTAIRAQKKSESDASSWLSAYEHLKKTFNNLSWWERLFWSGYND